MDASRFIATCYHMTWLRHQAGRWLNILVTKMLQWISLGQYEGGGATGSSLGPQQPGHNHDQIGVATTGMQYTTSGSVEQLMRLLTHIRMAHVSGTLFCW